MTSENNIIYGQLENDEIVDISDVDLFEKVIKQVNDNLKNYQLY